MSCPVYHKDLYFLAVHVLSLVETPLMFFVMYCIVFQSPIALKNFKWLLLTQQILIMILQIFVVDASGLILHLPAAAFVFFGLLNDWVSEPTQWAIALGLFGAVFSVTIALFEYRHQLIVSKGTWRCFPPRLRKVIFVLRFLVGICFGAPYWALAGGQQEAIDEWVKKIPCVLVNIDQDTRTLFYTTHQFSLGVIFMFLIMLPLIFELAFYIHDSFRLLNTEKTKHLSKRTRIMQKAFLRVLLFQEITPIAIAYPLPIAYLTSSIVFGFMNIDLNNASVFVAMTHGIIAGIAVLVANRSYRKFVVSLMRRSNFLRKQSTMLVTRYLSSDRFGSRQS